MRKMFRIFCIFFLIAGSSNAATWQKESIGGFGEVYICTPESVSPIGSGRSLLIALHGCLQTNEDMKGAKWEAASEQYGMVVALPEAMHKEGMLCWGYWTFPKNRNTRDYENIYNLVSELLSRANMKIDKDQVYIAGLSSGGAFAMNVGCMMPDIFAGMGINAGPSVGTDSSCAIGRLCGTVESTARACLQLAGSNQACFDTQVASTIYGKKDDTVDPGYSLQNARAMAKIYNAQENDGEMHVEEGNGGAIRTWSKDGSVVASMTILNGVDHAWPGGEGASGRYIDNSGFNYAAYLAKFFIENNRRAQKNMAPVVRILNLEFENTDILVHGKATDPDPSDSISSLKIKFVDKCNTENVLIPEENITGIMNPDGTFFYRAGAPFNNKTYVCEILAKDSQLTQNSETRAHKEITVGTPPEPSLIKILNQDLLFEDTCIGISFSGEVTEGSGSPESVYVKIDSGDFEKADGTANWTYKKCDLKFGRHTAVAKVTDSGGCIAFSDPVDIFLEGCKAWTASNYEHREEGRARRSFVFLFPFGFGYYYYAIGSNEPLGWGRNETTLRQEKNDYEYYKQGACL